MSWSIDSLCVSLKYFLSIVCGQQSVLCAEGVPIVQGSRSAPSSALLNATHLVQMTFEYIFDVKWKGRSTFSKKEFVNDMYLNESIDSFSKWGAVPAMLLMVAREFFLCFRTVRKDGGVGRLPPKNSILDD